jgi:hypothetical protein
MTSRNSGQHKELHGVRPNAKMQYYIGTSRRDGILKGPRESLRIRKR